MKTFKVGDYVEHWHGPDMSGGNPSCYGCRGVVIEVGEHHCQVMMDDKYHQSNGGPIIGGLEYASAWTTKHLRLVYEEIPYNPNSEGETDDDI